MKKIFKIFIFMLSFSLITVVNLYDSNAVKSNGVDYLTLETGDVIEINGEQFYPVILPNDGSRLVDYRSHITDWSTLSSIDIQAPTPTSFYFYSTTGEQTLIAHNVFKLVYELSTPDFTSTLSVYGLNSSRISRTTIGVLHNWTIPEDTIIITTIQGYASLADGSGYDETDLDNAYDEGFNDGKAEGLMVGYYAGLEVNNSEAYNVGYDKGFSEGSTDSFNANLSNWIVPAIVIVLFLGGVIVILNRRMGGNND